MSKKNLKIKTTGTVNTEISYGASTVKSSNSWEVKLHWKDLKKFAKKAIKIKEGLSFEEFLCKCGLEHLQNEKAASKLRRKFDSLRETQEKQSRDHDIKMEHISRTYDNTERCQNLSDAAIFNALKKRASDGNVYVHCPTTGNTNKG